MTMNAHSSDPQPDTSDLAQLAVELADAIEHVKQGSRAMLLLAHVAEDTTGGTGRVPADLVPEALLFVGNQIADLIEGLAQRAEELRALAVQAKAAAPATSD